jgi:hypothetical protein
MKRIEKRAEAVMWEGPLRPDLRVADRRTKAAPTFKKIRFA